MSTMPCVPGPTFWNKFFICIFVGLTAWNLTKVPLYLAFDENGDSAYEKRGLAGSINLEYWIDGFRSSKLHSPACNFLLVHIGFGSTVLIMMALTLYKVEWRKKYGNYFFISAILLAAHTIPSALGMHKVPLKILFTFTCVWCIVAAVCGFYTLKNYDKDPVKAEKHLFIEYSLITLGACGAGLAEFSGIFAKVKYRLENSEWMTYGESPDPAWGQSIYFLLPEKVGVFIFFLTVFVVGVAWPMHLLEIPIPGRAQYTPI